MTVGRSSPRVLLRCCRSSGRVQRVLGMRQASTLTRKSTPALVARPSLPRAGSQGRALSSSVRSRGDGRNRVLLLGLVAAGASTLLVEEQRHGATAECGGAEVHHRVFVAGSKSGSYNTETVIGSPQEIQVPGGKGAVSSVACAPEWIVVAKKGAVYLSEGPESEALTVHSPSRGWFYTSDAIVDVACTRDTIYGRTSNGAVMYWCVRRKGGKLHFQGPCYFSELRSRVITQVAAGPDHVIFVTRRGLALGMGDNAGGMVGTGGEPGEVKNPTLLKLPQGKSIVRAACGGAHTLLLDSDGTVYSCGSDQWYQLGHGETWKVTKDREQAFLREPTRIRDLDQHPIGAIAAGGYHSLFALAYDGVRVRDAAFRTTTETPARVQEVWANGFGQYGQLGDRAYVHFSTLRRIKDLRIYTPIEDKLPTPQIACGELHSVALVHEPIAPLQEKDGQLVGPAQYQRKVYVFGHNLGAQCGTGKAGNIARPTVPQVIASPLIDLVAAGFDWTVFVQRDEEVPLASASKRATTAARDAGPVAQ